MRRWFAGSLLGLGAVAWFAYARPDSNAPTGPYEIGSGAELMTQQAPQQAPPRARQQAPGQEPIDVRGMFDDPRGPQLEYEEVQRTAGRFPFYWIRAIYSGGGFGRRGFGGGSWAVDFPKSDQQFLIN